MRRSTCVEGVCVLRFTAEIIIAETNHDLIRITVGIERRGPAGAVPCRGNGYESTDGCFSVPQ